MSNDSQNLKTRKTYKKIPSNYTTSHLLHTPSLLLYPPYLSQSVPNLPTLAKYILHLPPILSYATTIATTIITTPHPFTWTCPKPCPSLHSSPRLYKYLLHPSLSIPTSNTSHNTENRTEKRESIHWLSERENKKIKVSFTPIIHHFKNRHTHPHPLLRIPNRPFVQAKANRGATLTSIDLFFFFVAKFTF